MAVLAAQDWHPPRDHTMDVPAQNASVPRQRPSPVNDAAPTQTPQPAAQPQQQPYPYPVQQQQAQGAWTPSIAAQPFYPSYYTPQQQSAYAVHGHTAGHGSSTQLPQQNPYFDPAANAQLAQWAYQQMMFNAQQVHQMSHMSPHHSAQQRGGPGVPQASGDYFAHNQVGSPFNAFPSGTPPPPAHPGHQNFPGATGQRNAAGEAQYNGFHPYRRPNNRQASHSSDSEWRPPPPSFQPPYARNTDASGSSSSVNSVGTRQRTNSNQSAVSAHNVPTVASASGSRSRSGSAPPSTNVSSRSSSGTHSPTPTSSSSSQPRSHRQIPSTSSASSTPARSSSPSPASRSPSTSLSSTPAGPTSHSSSAAARPSRPSPLSQGTFTASEKRMSRDDSDLKAMSDATPSASMIRSGGLKGRLRRVLTFNNVLQEEDDVEDTSSKTLRAPPSASGSGHVSTPSSDGMDVSDAASTATVQTPKKSRAASLFNRRLNASTDNISLSSTVSSASVMIRKLGSIGKLARRNSLAGITSLFKDKKDKEGGDEEEGTTKKDKKDKKKKSSKGEVSVASVSHVTAELEPSSNGDWTASPEMAGLSPAAKLARQHTLKSNAEAAARAKEREAVAVAAAAAAAAEAKGVVVPSTWEKNTATRAEASPLRTSGTTRISEDGTRVLVENDDSGSDDGWPDTHMEHSFGADGWDDDDDWGHGDDEDVTIRATLTGASLGDGEESEPWAVDIRRSMEKTRKPTKGILKNAGSYDQAMFLLEQTANARVRSNSYNSQPSHPHETGPLARLPSPDPDHIDGLHRHPSHSSHASQAGGTFKINGSPLESSKDLPQDPSGHSHPEKNIFNHPNLNSSAPALSTMVTSPPTLTHRAATAPAKRLAFATNLSVYDTFSASAYDRTSEPATWSRLTPALAQRIKEELNSYKMEEMEVHAASRIHTQFFV